MLRLRTGQNLSGTCAGGGVELALLITVCSATLTLYVATGVGWFKMPQLKRMGWKAMEGLLFHFLDAIRRSLALACVDRVSGLVLANGLVLRMGS